MGLIIDDRDTYSDYGLDGESPYAKRPSTIVKAIRALLKYSDDQPRDESGKWTSGGGGGASAGGSDHAESRTHGVFDRAQELLAQTQDVQSSLRTVVPEAWVEMSEVSVRTAQITDATLARMKEQGYKMPTTLIVGRDEQSLPHGLTRTLYNPSGVRTEMTVRLPARLPKDADPDDAVAAAFHGTVRALPSDTQYSAYDRFAVGNTRDIVVHEMAHVQKDLSSTTWNSVMLDHPDWEHGEYERAALRVSDYAASNPAEFVAEAFTRQYRGEKLAADSAKLYRDLKGPKVKR